mmetsp:Transcript_38531/g.108934  ORF Transcript_38531/g.108934 Transcript_38531/m.108934 type:complete len:287 (+) Transcript_38531:120-980(+)
MKTTKNTRNTISTAKIFMISHRLEEMVLRYFSRCACAPSTFCNVSSTFSSIRTAISPCCWTMCASCWKMPPSSTMVDSTLRSASARVDMYESCGAASCSCCCWSPPLDSRGVFSPAPPCKEPFGAPPNSSWALFGLLACGSIRPCPPSPRGAAGKFEALPVCEAEYICRRFWWTFRLSVRIVSTSLNSFVASLRRERRLSTTVVEWKELCLLHSRLLAATFCRSAIAALRPCISCFIMLVSLSISTAGSSNIEVRLASWASFCSLVEVSWMDLPMSAAFRANSDCC